MNVALAVSSAVASLTIMVCVPLVWGHIIVGVVRDRRRFFDVYMDTPQKLFVASWAAIAVLAIDLVI